MIFTRRRENFFFILSALLMVIAMAGCGNRQAVQAPQPVKVKAMQVVQQDTPVTYEFVGQVIAKNEVQIRAKVSGNIVEKMVTGGDKITQGQPLFQIDRRQYEAALLTNQAQLAQSEATLSNAQMDTMRYQKLAAQQAIPMQTLDTALSSERQNAAQVNANRARVQLAEADLQDTLIVSPFGGRIDVNDLSVGSFVQAGQTVIATLSSVDPIFIQFSMSENEYLRFTQVGRGASPKEWGNNLKLILSDGSQFPLTGHIEQVDRGMAQDTATLTMKAAFDNPQEMLMPGMFARVVAQSEVRQGALLIPQRAVQQLLGNTFVTIVGADDKAEPRPVKLGPRIGNLWVIEEGLTTADRVIVEGFAKTPPGTLLSIEMIDQNELQSAAKN
ncbi:efflux RND transporter periplasmic adaptor subunit [Pelosinus baikalensis]|uniref:Efflux RND transporter periplasmic adaptor subunit n=1 Tax=Pelosinus baikalensis TaxID=2892015 RepID=A0ABS8HY43_9FIRM|nr:efflux RND transporter periplasmic adaptor subunit [Pelosinus baikalensis]MCC5466899.1 efflux RND transporter periplasmic adaptor subunit [Pelosinus baikalensis]